MNFYAVIMHDFIMSFTVKKLRTLEFSPTSCFLQKQLNIQLHCKNNTTQLFPYNATTICLRPTQKSIQNKLALYKRMQKSEHKIK